MRDIENSLRRELRDPRYSEGYAESFLNTYIATQIKVLREQRQRTQAELAKEIGTSQTGISRIENVNYSSWSIRTLIKLARAFDVRLRVSFEQYGTLPNEVVGFSRESLERVKREDDPGLAEEPISLLDGIVDIGAWKVLKQGDQKKTDSERDSGFLSQIVEASQQQFDTQEALCR